MNLAPGSPFELFGGNVVGKVESAEAPKKLVQSWQARSPSWPSGELSYPPAVRLAHKVDHFGTLTTTLNQGSNSTDCKPPRSRSH
jgi:activator of HSP90 ATPase